MFLEWLRAHIGDLTSWGAAGGSGSGVYMIAAANNADGGVALAWSAVAICVVAVVTGQLVPRWKHTADLKYRENLIVKKDEQLDALLNRESLPAKLIEDLRGEVQRALARPRQDRR